MVAVEAVAGIYQIYFDLPRLRQEVAAGQTTLPEVLQSKQGLDRFYGDEAFGTFGNPNSLAGYLLVGILLLAGLSWERLRSITLRYRTRSRIDSRAVFGH